MRTVKVLAPLIFVIVLSVLGLAWQGLRANRITSGGILPVAEVGPQLLLPHAVRATGPWY
jgi:hypothetical protein